MKRASISEAKNQLSALIDRVRHGEAVVIEDRGIPVARLESVVSVSGDGDGRLERLERQGAARRPTAAPPKELLATSPPRPRRRRRGSQILISERRNGR